MGVQINPQNPIISASRRDVVRLYPPVQNAPKAPDPNTPDQPPLPKAGFGEGTASQATAAFVTLGRGLRAARAIVPTVEDLRAELRARLAEARARRERPDEGRDIAQAQLRPQESAPRADEAVAPESQPESPAPARTEEPTAPEPLPATERFPRVSAEPPGSRLDITA